MEIKHYRSNGKLMLTGEYLALDNALVLTLPTQLGQTLTVEKSEGSGQIEWTSYTNTDQIWFKGVFGIHSNGISIVNESNIKVAETLVKIFAKAVEFNSNCLDTNFNYTISTKLEFPQNWGLGSSSTLINNIAQWFEIPPFQLHFIVFNGSGYDIAAANNNTPITYLINNQNPIIERVNFNPTFKDHIYFVHLNEKQNSYNEVKKYQQKKTVEKTVEAIAKTDIITQQILTTQSLVEFEKLLQQHEQILSDILGLPTIHTQLFNDYNSGVIKSLGAWGGDFVLVTGNEKSIQYFLEKGYSTIFRYSDLIL